MSGYTPLNIVTKIHGWHRFNPANGMKPAPNTFSADWHAGAGNDYCEYGRTRHPMARPRMSRHAVFRMPRGGEVRPASARTTRPHARTAPIPLQLRA